MDWIDEYEKFRNQPWNPTVLEPQQEQLFREWLPRTKWYGQLKSLIGKKSGFVPDDSILFERVLNDNSYDYRGAWVSGVEPKDYEYDSDIQHWQSMTDDGRPLKSPRHPTGWMEYFMKQYGTDPMSLGISTYDDAVKFHNDQLNPKNPDVEIFNEDLLRMLNQ